MTPLRVLAALLVLLAPAAWADPTFPGTLPGTGLRLNGTGERLYSVFRVKVYTAALYLEQPGHDADAILDSPRRKAIVVRALRAVAAADIADGWRASFAANCTPPCRLPADAGAFLAAVQPSREGAVETYLVDPSGLTVLRDNKPAGTYGSAFARLLLATFIGAAPPSEALKRALLGGAP